MGRIAELLRARKRINYIAYRENARFLDDPWEISQRASVVSYDETFKEVLHGESSNNLLLSRRQHSGRGAVVLDIMGYMPLGLMFDGGVGLALGDRRTMEEKESDNKRGVVIITGDVLEKGTWRKVSEWKTNRGIKGFDLIYCRPQSGFKTIPQDPDVYFYLLQNAWNLLSSEGGMMLTQAPYVFGNLLSEWQEQVNMTKGVYAETATWGDYIELKLIKNFNAPPLLPALQRKGQGAMV